MKNNRVLILVFAFVSISWNIYPQCADPDPSIWENTWLSCKQSQNPNQAHGEGHWILYDFSREYFIGQSWIWNTNESGATDQGIKDVVVDYSNDGVNWTLLGEFTFAKAPGTAQYGGFAGPDFGGKSIRYVLITALNNWGSSNCYGLAEVKFNLEQTPIELPDPGTLTYDEEGCRTVQDTSGLWFTVNSFQIDPEELEFPASDDGSILALFEADQSFALTSFEGNSFQLFATTSPEAAFGSIVIDNQDPVTLSWHSDLPKANQILFEANELGEGKHTFFMVSHGPGVNVDYISACLGDETVSVDDFNSKAETFNLQAYPNPVSQFTFLQTNGSGNISRIQLYNATGSTLTAQKFMYQKNGNGYQLDCKDLSNGTYFIIALDENGRSAAEKIIVQH